MENKDIIVRIPEPCHEDWNKMTPDNTGKFCGSCQKSVFDFSNKTDTEIKDILMQYKDQKVCGRFKKSQIDRPLSIRVNLNDLPKNVSITKMFALALLLTFSATLFSCFDPHGKKINGIEWFSGKEDTKEELVGDVMFMPEKIETIKKDTLVEVQTAKPEMLMNVEQYVAGGIGMEMISPMIDSIYTPQVLTKDSVYEVQKMGEVVPEEYLNNTIEHKDDTLCTNEESKDMDERRIMGGPMLAIETVTEEVTESGNKINNVEEKTIIKENSFVVYPNPGNGNFTIKYEVTKRSEVRVDVLDVEGKLITNISDIARQYEGKYEIPVSLDVPNGIYFVSIIADGKKNVSKVIIQK